MNTRETLNLVVETYSSSTHNFTEYTLKSKYELWTVLQLLAFNGRAHEAGGNFLHLTDWSKLQPEVVNEISETVFTSVPAAMRGVDKRDSSGMYVFKSVAVDMTVQGGMISMPDSQKAKSQATDLKRRVLI